jgi:hypothetical protein
MAFAFEKLIVYQKAVDVFVRLGFRRTLTLRMKVFVKQPRNGFTPTIVPERLPPRRRHV